MRNGWKNLGIAAGVWGLGLLPAPGHGLRHEVSDGAIAVHWRYDDGRPMVSRKVTVLAPGNRDVPYLEGVTDTQGAFSFLAHTNGRWKVTVDDGQGHRADVYVDVDHGRIQTVGRDVAWRRPEAAVVGVSVLFGCFGLYALFACRFRRGRVTGTV